MNKNDLILAFREGGQTLRCHTFPYGGQYNVATHSYNALSLLFLLHPKKPPSLNLIKAVLWHDVPERWTGDTPAPAKWASPLLKRVLDSIEEKIFAKLQIGNIFKSLTTLEKNWLTAVDLLELFIWSKEQSSLGNRQAKDMERRVHELMLEKGNKIPKEIQHFIANFEWGRTVECSELLSKQEIT